MCAGIVTGKLIIHIFFYRHLFPCVFILSFQVWKYLRLMEQCRVFVKGKKKCRTANRKCRNEHLFILHYPSKFFINVISSASFRLLHMAKSRHYSELSIILSYLIFFHQPMNNRPNLLSIYNEVKLSHLEAMEIHWGSHILSLFILAFVVL